MTDTARPPHVRPPEPRVYSGLNWEGMKTLYLKEVRRFWKVGAQTVFAPVVTTLLYMMVFVVAMGDARPHGDIDFGAFVGPGLIMMAILNNAFANSSSSLIQAKIMGTATDFMTPPLSPIELLLGFGLGAATRGIVVGIATAVCVWPFAHFTVTSLVLVLFFGLMASLMLGLMGVLAGLWAEKFDHLSAVQNFVIMPLTFLSGTFYTVDALPEPFRALSHFNPFFYLIDGFRAGFIGHADGSILIGVILTLVLTTAVGAASYVAFKTGWHLKT